MVDILAKNPSYDFFKAFVKSLAKARREETKLAFLFDIFSCFDSSLNQTQMTRFVKIFHLKPDFFGSAKSI